MTEQNAQWQDVSDLMQGQSAVKLGHYTSYWMRHSPRRALHYLSYYKFASKLIGKPRRVLDVGCAEGLGTWVLAVECGGQVTGLDMDAELVDYARHNWSAEEDARIRFETGDFLKAEAQAPYQALVSFDVIEHIVPEQVPRWWAQIKVQLSHDGLAIIGTPSEISQTYASEISKKGHVNIYSAERLRAEMLEHFHHVFMFAAHDEVVHTGFMPLAHYQIALGCRPRRA